MNRGVLRLKTAATMHCKVTPESTLSAARVLVLHGNANLSLFRNFATDQPQKAGTGSKLMAKKPRANSF
jgi:hypothetical protein